MDMIGKVRRMKLRDQLSLSEIANRTGLSRNTTVHRWAIKVLPVLATLVRRRKRAVGRSWRLNETYLKVSGEWTYLYRAVDKHGDTVDFLLPPTRDKAAALRFLERAIELHDVPEKISIDKSGANAAAIESLKDQIGVEIELSQSKYLNNLVEQDHRAIKRITRPMMRFKAFGSARTIIASIETMHMIKKGQLGCSSGKTVSAADQFYALAF